MFSAHLCLDSAYAVQAIGTGTQLLPVHRLDCGTEGVLVLGKTLTATRKLNRWFAGSSSGNSQACVRKVYRALSAKPMEVGTYQDWLLTDQGSRPRPRHTTVAPRAAAGAVRAVLEVTTVRSPCSQRTVLCFCIITAMLRACRRHQDSRLIKLAQTHHLA